MSRTNIFALVGGNRFKEEWLRRYLLLQFLEEGCGGFGDIGFRLSVLLFEIDPERSYQFSGRVMQWRSDIEARWLLFHKWLPGFHRGSLVLIAPFPQIWLRGSDCYAPLLTRRRGGKLQDADLRMF